MYELGSRIRHLYDRFSKLTSHQRLKIAYFLMGIGLAIVIGLFAVSLHATEHQGHRTAVALKDYESFGAQRRSLNNENLKHIKEIVNALSTDFRAACKQTEAVNGAIRFTINQSIIHSPQKLTRAQRHEVNVILHRFKPVNCKIIPGGVNIKF